MRKFFRSKELALAYIGRVEMDGARTVLVEDNAVVRRIHADLTGGDEGASVGALAAEWIGTISPAGSYAAQLRYWRGRFCDHFRGRAPEKITHHELAEWLEGTGLSATSVNNLLRLTRRFFEWLVEWKELDMRNPAKKIKRKTTHTEVAVLTPQEMAQALAQVMDMPRGERLAAALVLSGFCGLRTVECLRARWEDIDLEAGEIHVREPKTTRSRVYRQRFVDINPTAHAWLTRLHQHAGPVLGWNDANFRHARTELVTALGWRRWPPNALRHSFGTYHLAQVGDAGKTAHQMGHTSTETTLAHYAIAARRADADAWWGILPGAAPPPPPARKRGRPRKQPN